MAALVAGGIKGIGGLIQGIGGARKQRDLWNNRPQLGVTAGETANNSLYKQMASATTMPGQQQQEERLGQTYAEGVNNVQQSANSSLNATQGAIDLAGKRMQATQDLAGMFAEYKQKAMNNLGQWNNQQSQNEMQRFQVNQFDPWQMKYGEAVGQKQAGFANAMSGLDSQLGTLGNIQGTDAMMNAIKAIQTNQFGGGLKSNFQSKPVGGAYNPQQNLLNTLSGLIHK